MHPFKHSNPRANSSSPLINPDANQYEFLSIFIQLCERYCVLHGKLITTNTKLCCLPSYAAYNILCDVCTIATIVVTVDAPFIPYLPSYPHAHNGIRGINILTTVPIILPWVSFHHSACACTNYERYRRVLYYVH